MATIKASLRAGLDQLGLLLADNQIEKLLAFMALLQKWNKVYNLTAVRDAHGILTCHLLDCLAALVELRQSVAEPWALSDQADRKLGSLRLLDVGSGAGLPGVVFAICCPNWEVTCIDAVAKKTAFIQQVAVELQLANLHARHARVETLTEPFDVVCSRAFASLADFTNGSHQALARKGFWFALKGKYPADEIAALPNPVDVFHVKHIRVPGLDAERCLVWLRPRLA